MQLYIVAYQTHWVTHIDMGRTVVQAANAEDAEQMLCAKFNLPRAKTHFSIETVNDGVLHLTRRTVSNPGLNVPKLDLRESDRERPAPTIPYDCQVLGIVMGQDEWHALKRLCHTVLNRCNDASDDRDKYVTKLMITAEARVPGHDKMRLT